MESWLLVTTLAKLCGNLKNVQNVSVVGLGSKLIHKKEMGEFFNVHELYEKSTIQTF